MNNFNKDEKRCKSLSRPKVIEMRNKSDISGKKLNKSIDRFLNKQSSFKKCYYQAYEDEKTNAFSRTRLTQMKERAILKNHDEPVLDQSSKRTHTSTETKKKLNFRQLLPNYLNTKLPQVLAQLCAITYKLDQYLSNLPNIPNTKNKSESFYNIKLYFQIEYQMQITQLHFKQINFIAFGFYTFCQDPLKNFIIQFPKSENIHIRQQTFRKMIYNYYIKSVAQNKVNEDVPYKQFLLKKTSCFYEKKKFKETKNTKSIQKQKSKINQQFIDKIVENVKRMQEKHKKCLQVSNTTRLKKQSINSIKVCIDEIYRQQKVSNIYKASLVELIQQRMKIGIELILKGLEQILAMNQNLNQVMIKERPIISYELDSK